ADTGAGIPEAELPHIFERFHRVRDIRSRTHEGTGIGLALVEELVKLHGGEVTVESAVGRGTTFLVSIPTGAGHLPKEQIGVARRAASTSMGATPFVEEALRWLPDEEGEERKESAEVIPAQFTQADVKSLADTFASALPLPRSPARILVADDNADMRNYLRRLLASRYIVTAVADGVAALDAARREPPDLILTDVMMPNLDGFGLLRAIRDDARLAGVPVILLSARAGEESTVEGMQAGADDYLIKPFSVHELLARIEAQIRRKRAEQECARLLVEVAESRHLFERIAETSPDALYIYDLATGRTIYANARGEQVIGYTADEVMDLGDRFAVTLWHPDDALKLPEHRRKLKELAEGEIAEFEYRVRQHDGTYRWLRSRTSVFARINGQAGQIIIVTQDVTEYKRAGEALRKIEERFRRYFELGLIGMAITTPTRGIIEINDEICKILGCERDELLRMSWAEMTHPDDLAADTTQFNRVMAGEIDGYSMDKRFIRKDGEVIDTTISVKCLRRADGSVDYFVALLEDITERTRAEEALRRAHDQLEQRVIERTSQLSAINDEMLAEIAQRQRVEVELTRLKDELANDLETMKGLHELSTRLLTATALQPLLEEVLDSTMGLLNADFGNVQLYDRTSGTLKIVAQRGFKQDFLDYFDSVHEGTASCGAALQSGARVIVEDVLTDPIFAPHLEIVASAGYRAVQSTPLFSRSGEPLGMLSTHFREPHRPSERELRLTDLYARLAAEMIERKRTEEHLAYHARLLEDVHDAVIATDEELGITAWNKGACEMYGWTADEVMGRHIWEAVRTEMSEEQRAESLRSLAETGRFSIEVITYGKGGRPVYVEGITIALRGEHGKTTGYVNIRRDVSKRKRAEEALKESHSRLENVLESITEDFYTVDREWRFTYINERALRSVQRGQSKEIIREDLLGRNMWECFPELVGTDFTRSTTRQ
ncbi:MAG TPA: PAS domain S-box protein, partial [Blastocatellia bacterium]|nr:PAS domain S-box protein [Blastocatellia bacterium]